MDSFEQQNFKPNILLETNNYDFIKDVVLRGEAGTFLTEAEIDSLAQEEELIKIPVKDHKMSLKIYVAYSTDRPLSLPARTFLECLGRLDQVTKPFPYLAPTWPDDFPFTDDNP